MGIDIDAHQTAELERLAMSTPIRIKTPLIYIDLTATSCLANARRYKAGVFVFALATNASHRRF
jgi:hypothetical protein